MPTNCKQCNNQLVFKGQGALSAFNAQKGGAPGAGTIDVGRGGVWGGAEGAMQYGSAMAAPEAGICTTDM